MKLLITIYICLVFSVNAETFPEKFAKYMKGERQPISDHLLKNVQGHQFVFISGVLQEFVSPYFKRSTIYLSENFGVPKSPVLSPGTFSDLEKSAAKLHADLLKIHNDSKKPLIVISHSKGSVIINLLLFRYPELVRDGIIKKSISMQGAFGGSKVADYVVADHSHWFGKLLKPILHLLKPIAEPLATESAGRLLEENLKNLNSNDFNLISDAIWYIRSTKPPKKTVSYLRIFNTLLHKKFGKNDGMILIEDQKMESIGTDLGVIQNIDHIDFILDKPLSSSIPKTREVIIRLIIEEIFN